MKNLDEILGEWGGENFVHLPHIYIVRMQEENKASLKGEMG